MELGLKNGTNIIPLSNSDWSEEKIHSGDYLVLKLTITIEGKEHNILNFIKGLQDLYPTLVIENLQILTIDANTSDSTNSNQTVNNDRFTSNLSVVIYSR
jgi:hypothetical protein